MQQKKKQRQRPRQQPEPFEPYHTDTQTDRDRYTHRTGRQVFHGPFQKKRMRNVTGYPYLVGALNNADSEEMHSKRKYKKMKNTLAHRDMESARENMQLIVEKERGGER